MDKYINILKSFLDIVCEFVCFNWKLIVTILIFLIAIIFIVINIKKIENFIKKIIVKIKNYYNNYFYRILLKNILLVIFGTFGFMMSFEGAKYYFSNKLNIHLNFNENLDYFSIYGCILSLLLPLIILLIERINDKDDYIIRETYLRDTKMFPALIYFCTNIIFFIFNNDVYYFLFSVLFSMLIIIMMYYKSYKLLSNKVYEKSQIGKTRSLLIDDDFKIQLKNLKKDNKIRKYYNYGIYIDKYNYVNTEKYKMIRLYSNDELFLIEDYNYKIIFKILDILKECNNKEKKDLNVLISLKDIGFTLKKHQGYISIYYKENYEKEAEKIANLATSRIYIINEHNTHFYVKNNYEYIQKECINAINNNSPLELELSLNKYIDIYKDYIVGIKEQIGDYDYKLAYEQNHSIVRHRVYELLELMVNDIVEYVKIIKEKNSCLLMNKLIGFVYKINLFSFEKGELLSIERLFNLFDYMLDISLQLNEQYSAEKIKTIVFEFMNLTKYEIDNFKNFEINKGILLVCNQTIGRILYNLNIKDYQIFEKWFYRYKKFIGQLKEKQEILSVSAEEKNTVLNCYNELLKHFECNLFATFSYMIKINLKDEQMVKTIYNYYDGYNSKLLSEIYLDTIQLDFEEHTYSWDLLEERNYDSEGVWSVKTTDYLTDLYCELICQKDSSQITIPDNYAMTTRIDNIIERLRKINKIDYIIPFEKAKESYNERKKEKIMTTSISKERVDNFINNFNKNYNKSILYNILKLNDKISIVEEDEKSKKYLITNNIVEKEYFLNQDDIDENIYWDNFESYFVESFTNAEETKYSEIISKKTKIIDKNIMDYIEDIKTDELKDYIIFKNYKSLYKTIEYEHLVWKLPEDYIDKYNNYVSCYLYIKNVYIPIVDLEGLDEAIYLFKSKDLMTINKSAKGFKINIQDFTTNKELLEKNMKNKIQGLDLEGEERRKHLLSSVDIEIKEYVSFDEENLSGYKFRRKEKDEF